MADKAASFFASRLLAIPAGWIVMPVLSLLFARGPTTVARFVVSVVVDSFNRHLRRSWPHVGEKVLEDKPPRTELYSSTTIPAVMTFVRVCGALFDAVPNLVFGAIRRAVCGNCLFMKASTTFVLPACEVAHKRNASIPTRALAAVSPLLSPLGAI